METACEETARRGRRVWNLGELLRTHGDACDVPGVVWERGALREVRSLLLSECPLLSRVPSELLRALTNVRVLDLSLNALADIDGDALAVLAPTLEALHLFGNRLVRVPDQLCTLARLQDLSLGGNRLRALPDGFSGLASLRNLSLANNQISALPEKLPGSLETLDLSNNAFESVPLQLGSLEHLRSLSLALNRAISVLPPAEWWAASLAASLEDVSLAFTSLESAAELSVLQKAQHIDLRGCSSTLVSRPVFCTLSMTAFTAHDAPPGLASPAIGRQGGKLVVVGGGCFGKEPSSVLSRASPPSVWHFSLAEERWATHHLACEQLPVLPAAHSMCFDSGTGRWIVFGGITEQGPTNAIARLLLYEDADVEVLNPSEGSRWPCPRWGHVAALMPNGKRMVVHGGRDESGAVLSDVWILDLETLQWSAVEQPDSARSRADHVAVVIGNELFVLCGTDESGNPTADIDALDLTTWRWRSFGPCHGSPPTPRSFPALAFDEASMSIILLGGSNGEKACGNAHALNLRTATWHALGLRLEEGNHTLSIRRAASIVAGGKVLLFGGEVGDPPQRSSNALLSCPVPSTLGPSVDL